MSIMSLGLSGLEKAPIPTSTRFPSSALPPLNPRFSSMDARLVAAARLPGLSVYGSPYASSNFSGYLPYAPAAAAVAAAAADPSAFYSSLGPGENAESWRASLSQAAAAAYYDPAMAAHYGYGYGPMGLSDGARRKNATRETTSTLKAWLNEHRKNPYPTKGEKIMLAIITKMTLTQVSTWFANARRRLKKENKMTWSPRNRCGEDDDDDDMVDEGHHNNENPNSRLSTPISPDLPPNGRISAHHLDRPFFNGHSSGVESNSDEGMNYSDARSEGLKPQSEGEKNERKSPPTSGLHQTNFDEARSRLSASHLSRQHSYPYDTTASSPSSLPPTTCVSSSIPRPNLPFSQPLPQLVPSHPNMMHPGLTEPLTHPSSLNRLPPHLMAALIEQFHYQQAMHGLPVNSLLNSNAEASKLPSSAISSATDNLGSPKNSSSNISSPTTISKPSSSVASPSKSKIWSIADVATSSDTSKNAVKTKAFEENVRPPHDKNGTNEIPSVRMWMDVLQHKIAASMSSTTNQQQMPQLTNCLNPNASAPFLAQGCFHSFPNFSGSVHARENLDAAVKDSEKCSQGLSEKSSSSTDNFSPVSKEVNISEKNAKNMCKSPSSPFQGDSSIEGSEAK